MNATRLYPVAGALSALAFGLLAAGGFAYSLLAERKLPPIHLNNTLHAETLMAAGRYPEARAELETGAALQPYNPWMHELRARLARETGDAELELRARRELVKLDPFDAERRVRLAEALLAEPEPGSALEQRRAERARDHARFAVQQAPGLAAAHAVLGRALLQLGEHASARTHLAEALRLDPQLEAARADLRRARGGQAS